MARQLTVLMMLALGSMAYWPQAARGSTVDTFSFTETGWTDLTLGAGGVDTAGNPEPQVLVTGSFTGTVESDGFIQLGDLSAFTTALFIEGNLEGILTEPNFFSFDTNGGASSLDFSALNANAVSVCLGAAATLSSGCTVGFSQFYPPSTRGVVEFLGNPTVVSPDAPVLTLQSSVTSPPPTSGTSSTATPEPSSLVLTGLALIAAGSLRRGRGRGKPGVPLF